MNGTVGRIVSPQICVPELQNMTLFGNRVIEDVMLLCSHRIRVGPASNNCCVCNTEEKDLQIHRHRGKCCVMTNTKPGEMLLC